MKKIKKAGLAVLAAVTALSLLCSGCGSKESTEVADRVTLTLATTESTRLDTDYITMLNSGDYPFTIEIVDYQEQGNGDAEKALAQLNKDLVSGDAPDLIDLSAFEFDLASYADKGVFEDLYPYIDADETLERTDFVDALLKATEYNGMLPGIMSGFTVKTMATTKEIAQNRTSWSLSEFSDHIENIGSAFLLAEEPMDMESLLYNLSQTTFKSYIDYTAGIANFDNQEFIELLSACASVDADSGNGIDTRMLSVGGFMEQQVLESSLGENIVYIGFPVISRNDYGSYINNQENYLAISSGSGHKAACWEFIRCFLLEDYQNSKYIKEVETAFPSNKNSLDKLAAYSMERIYSEDNSEITERGMYGDSYEPATQETVDQIMSLIESVQESQRWDPTALTDVMSEEINSMLSGEQSAEETANHLQNRISTLVSEYK